MIVLSLLPFLLILALIGFPNFSFSGRFSQSLDNLFFCKTHKADISYGLPCVFTCCLLFYLKRYCEDMLSLL